MMFTGKMPVQPLNYYDSKNMQQEQRPPLETQPMPRTQQMPPQPMPMQQMLPQPYVVPEAGMVPQQMPPMFDNSGFGFDNDWRRRLLQQYMGNGMNPGMQLY